MNEENVIYLVIEYYSAIKRIEIPKYATMWMNFENIMLSERSWTKGHIFCGSVYMKSIHTGKSRLVVVRDWGSRVWGVTA